ncbi:hypothetical protein EGW08_012292, partial [Elysia chlorotica]
MMKLDLSENSVVGLPMCSFSDLISLKYLWLSKCQIISVASGLFANLKKLRTLDLAKNNLATLRNDTFSGLESLEFLNLQGNELRYQPWTFEPGAFHGLDSLTHLHLEGNQPDLPANFTYPDVALARVPTLQHLWLDGHPYALGRGFASLSQLSDINFVSGNGGFCNFNSDLPANFLSNLISKRPLNLRMVQCSISFIPSNFFDHVKNIFSLDLSFNRELSIDGFEKASKGLQNSTLTILNITEIVKPFSSVCNILNGKTFQYLKTTQLKELIVKSNFLVNVLPNAILDLPKTIEYVNLHRNNILKAFAFFTLASLPNLKIVDIAKQVYYEEDNRRLDFCDNRSKHIQNTFFMTTRGMDDDKPSVQENETFSFLAPYVLPLTANSRSSLNEKDPEPAEFCDGSAPSHYVWPVPPKLERLYASDIKLHYDIPQLFCSTKNVLNYLDLSANGIHCFGGPVHGLRSLQTLDLSRNQCYRINPSFFSTMPNLVTLLLSGNFLGEPLSSDTGGLVFSTLDRLQLLDLSNNVLKDLSEFTFQHNRHLRVLNLSFNAMSTFLPILTLNRKLQTLDLSNNTLLGFPESTCHQFLEFKKINSNFTVNISGNSDFVCNCDNLFFLNLILRQPEIFKGVALFRCQLDNGSFVRYDRLSQLLPELEFHCVAQSVFVGVLVTFFLVVGSLSVYGMFHYKRWQWKYLY